jgi:hypothetical protein
MTTMTLTARAVETRLRPLYATGFIHGFEKHHGRVQMYDSTAFILGALLSACVAHYAGLRLEYFLTIPFTCCAFVTLRRFREPTLHRQAPESGLSGHLGQVVRAVLQPTVALIIVAAVAGSASVVVMCATLSMIVVKRQ